MELFHTLFSATYLAMLVIRMLSWRTAIGAGGKVALKEGKLNMAVRAIIGVGYIGVLMVYVFYPRYLAWAIFPLPLWARWIGALVSVGAIILLGWVQWALGKNFNTTLHIREQHTLITHGPYRWVRHPMYTALFSLGVGWLLLTANGVVGVPLPVAIAILIFFRVPREEALMIEQFGDTYRNYMARTGRFFPRLLRGA